MSTRREFMGHSALAVGGMTFGAAFTMPACGKKDLSAWVSTIAAAFSEIKPLLPQLGLSSSIITRVSELIDKGASIARAFDEAYRKGEFSSAATLFSSLSGLITSVAAELNVTDNRIVKLALVALGIARIAIATLLNQQAAALPESMTRSRNSAEAKAVSEIRRLAEVDISKIVLALP